MELNGLERKPKHCCLRIIIVLPFLSIVSIVVNFGFISCFFFLFFKMFEIFLRFYSIISFNFHNTSQTQCASLGLRSWFLCVEAAEVQ